MEQPQDSQFKAVTKTRADGKRKPKKAFWKLTFTVIACEIMLILTILFVGFAHVFGKSKYDQLIMKLWNMAQSAFHFYHGSAASMNCR
jgi:cytoskeletal protein RodZ